MASVIARYLPSRNPGKRLVGFQQDFVIIQWLNDLARGTHETPPEAELALARAGLFEKIRHAEVSVDDPL